jgi:hypothetical protein
LLRAAALDEGRLHALGDQPLKQGRGDELASVVERSTLSLPWRAERLELLSHVAGADRAIDTIAQREPGVLVDDVQDAQKAALARSQEVVRPTSLGAPAAGFQGAFA